MDYFIISNFEILCSIEIKQEYWLLDFEEINEVPNGYLAEDYESKGFMESAIIQDFPLRGKGVYLRIKRKRHYTGFSITRKGCISSNKKAKMAR